MRGRTRRVWVTALVPALAALAVPAAAQAVPLTNVNVAFGVPPGPTTIAGDEDEYTISFTAGAGGLNDEVGTAVIVNAAGPAPLAAGTIFPPSALHDDEGAFYAIGTADDPGNVVVADVIRQNGNQTVIIPTAETQLAAEAGETVTVTIGLLSEHQVQNRPTACDDCRLGVDTTMAGDDLGLSNPFDVVVGPGDLLVEAGDGQQATVGTAFGAALQAKLLDGAGDPVAGQNVTFTAPGTGPSGTFAGGTNGGLELTTTTDAEGVATASTLTANGEGGGWAVDVTTDQPDVTGKQIGLENVVGPPDAVELVVDPDVIEGNGVATSRATATVTDEFGNPAAEQDVTFSSDGDQQLSPTQELPGGIYRTRITSTTESGLFLITADVAGGSAPSDTAALAQTADATAPRARISGHPQKRSARQRARFVFDANSADVDVFECKLDGAPFRDCDSPKTYRVGRGRHTFRVRATDLTGNTGPADTFSFTRKRKRR